jgi:ribA/ribD-fused uncharacterized protein
MEALIAADVRVNVQQLVSIAASDKKAELEVKVLAGCIHTKDEADRIVKAIEEITVGGFTEEHRATFSYVDGLRVNVEGADNIFKVCSTGSFRGIPLFVERKRKYFDVPGGVSGVSDMIDLPDLKLRFTLRHEEPLRKDFSGSPMDPKNHVRILSRKSWKTADGMLKIDMSLTKTKTKNHKTFADVLKQTPSFELEVEVVNKEAPAKTMVDAILRTVEPLLCAFQQSAFLLTEADTQRYRMEFEATKTRFVNPITMERGHIVADRPNNILTGYTVTNKADGERSFLVVARDRRLIRITPSGKITWTGITANKDDHLGDIVDGEYLADRNLFCIFDVYVFRTKRVDRLPLMTTDDDVKKNPRKSRLGCASLFVDDLRKEFKASLTKTPFRVETKMFLAGDGAAMEQAINRLLDVKFEYPTDGLIFTPRASPVAPVEERNGSTWLRVYKWKPPTQNSIDFLVRYKSAETYDPVADARVFKGTLYISRNAGTDIIYPCETITGEYTPPELPADLKVLAQTRDRVPSPFQPSAPRSPNASEILIPLNGKGIPVDIEGNKVDDNTIIECARDTTMGRWMIMRTRYDKTYQYRVKGEPNYGNDISVAESIWTNIHNPVTEEMIRKVVTSPPSSTFEDDLYYHDAIGSRDRVFRDVREFHNSIKEKLYTSNIKRGDTLLELAVGRGGDLHKWRKTKPSKIVGIDLSLSNLEAPRQGACVRYLHEMKKSKLPPVLFIAADMTLPLMAQDNRYLKMLDNRESAPTPYLKQFAGLSTFDVISCQMAMHYACESEATFRTFVGNLTRHGKGLYFGTCLDGQAVYSLLLGNKGRRFLSGGTQTFGEFTKEYSDNDRWTEEFGRAIVVKLESFERPAKEFLVPFGKVVEIMKENGYDLVSTTMFSDFYAQQKDYVFGADHQAFSFLHRGFVFKRAEPAAAAPAASAPAEAPATAPAEAPAEAPVEEVTAPVEEVTAPAAPAAAKATAPRRTKMIRQQGGELPEIVFFFSGNPALNEYKEFSNMHEAPMQIGGITFPTVEHYYQWSKAKQFGAEEIATKILKTPSAKSVKALGQKVTPYDDEAWKGKRREVMMTALNAKFSQHPDILKKLNSTGTKTIAEANPRDKYWGIGTSAETSFAKNPSRWKGENMMGKLLEDVRTRMDTTTTAT